MKVTIISNGNQQLVLKPENRLEAITLEGLNGKTLEATHFDKPTQILNESYPDCLVLGKLEEKITQEEEESLEQVVLINTRTNTPVCIIPHGHASFERMCNSIQEIEGWDSVERIDAEGPDELCLDVTSGDEGSIITYRIVKTPIS